MTASQIANQLSGIHRGKRWICRCPVKHMHKHGDRHRSLMVWQSDDGWVRFKCYVGCTRNEILDAMGLKVRDLIVNDTRLSQKELRKLRAQRAADERREKAMRIRCRRLLDQARYWRSEQDRIMAELVREGFDSDTLARKYHWALERERAAQAQLRPFFPKYGAPGDYDL